MNNNDSGAGSLRQAIADIGSGGEITFDADYTITLASKLSISSDMTITGTGAGNTIIQSHTSAFSATYEVFDIGGGTVNLSEMTIRHGRRTSGYGGGVIVDGASGLVTISDCAIVDNEGDGAGGGIYNLHSALKNSVYYGFAITMPL